jgi:hypothetical protein
MTGNCGPAAQNVDGRLVLAHAGDCRTNILCLLIVTRCSPEGERQNERLDANAPPEGQFVLFMLCAFSGEVVIRTERQGPAIIGLFAEAWGPVCRNVGRLLYFILVEETAELLIPVMLLIAVRQELSEFGGGQ